VAAEEALRESEQNPRYLSSGLLKTQEKERHRIAYALHDELAQDLAVLTIEVKCIEEGLGDHQKALRDACRKTRRHIISIIENTRRLSQGLSPALLEELGLSAAVRWMIEDFTAQTDVGVTLDMEDIDHLFRRETEVIVYRIFQEAFTNIRKHAAATHVQVSIVRREGEVTVCIEDNGRGFHLHEVEGRRRPGKGLGLIAMDERVRMLGRTLHRFSDPGRGTRILFTVPVDREGAARAG
jgi:signal transduction histidine kinase